MNRGEVGSIVGIKFQNSALGVVVRVVGVVYRISSGGA
jgi:hypothetical protein